MSFKRIGAGLLWKCVFRCFVIGSGFGSGRLRLCHLINQGQCGFDSGKKEWRY